MFNIILHNRFSLNKKEFIPVELLVYRFWTRTTINNVIHFILLIIKSYIPNDWQLATSEPINGFNVERYINKKYYAECSSWNISNISNTKTKLLFGPKIKINRDRKYYNTYSCILKIKKLGSGCIGFVNDNKYVGVVLICDFLDSIQIDMQMTNGQKMTNILTLERPLCSGDTITVIIGLQKAFFGIKINNGLICRYKILIKTCKTFQLMIELLQGMSIKLKRYKFDHVKII